MRTHVQRTVSGCSAVLRQLRQIRNSEPDGHVPIVGGRTGDFQVELRNGMVIGLWTHRLLSVQNAAARLICNSDASITSQMHWSACHWLRNPERIIYKIAVLTFKVLHGITPDYLGPVVRVADLPGRRAFCSAGTNRLVVPPFKLSTIGRAFPGPQAWNSLPEDVTSAPSLSTFRQRLKTYLFRLLFPHLVL